MSNTSPIGEGSENIMEVLSNISKQVAEMNGRMGGMEERLVRVENENRRKAIQPEYDEIRKASVHSTTLASGQAHNLCSPPQSQTRNYQRPTFQTPNPPNHLRQPTPHPNPKPYHPPQENLPFMTNHVQYQTPFRNASNASFHEPYTSHPQNAPQMPYQDYQYQNPLYDEINEEFNNDEI
ncbi:hypothetical protein KY290_010832 [Solanum tuberosum]|uniref:Uncharacterized protein n=1 Tax=Solanum tuberosum TaxID=4113 RepID=A0ABQ7VYX6_SOLTU|nr:hypothetical protein KY290_010832 [Solanum tuberosum]